MSDMIERVARAIHFRGDDQGDDAWNHCQPWLRMVAREQARVAVEAMRKPTDEMVRAAHKDHEGEYYLPVSLWQSMIDAALSNSKGGEG